MKVTIIEIKGFKGAFASMFMSKRNWTPSFQIEINNTVDGVVDKNGFLYENQYPDNYMKFNSWLDTLVRISKRHITLGRFISFQCIVEGLHRGAQDDFDSHAKRLENKIIRNSTRLSIFDNNEKSDFYKDKILLMDEAIDILKDQGNDINIPDTIEYKGIEYVRSTNGYIDKKYEDDKDVKRGLYPLSIPSNFIFECNLTEWAHIVKERGSDSGAHPELKEMIEKVNESLNEKYKQFTKELFIDIKN